MIFFLKCAFLFNNLDVAEAASGGLSFNYFLKYLVTGVVFSIWRSGFAQHCLCTVLYMGNLVVSLGMRMKTGTVPITIKKKKNMHTKSTLL